MALLFAAAWSAEAHAEVAPHHEEVELAAEALNVARQRVAAASLQVGQTRAELDRFLKEHFTEQFADVPPLPTIVDNRLERRPRVSPEIERLEAQLAELRSRRRQLLQSLTEAHPEVVEVEARISTVIEHLSQERGEVAASPEQPARQGNDAWDKYRQRRQNQIAADSAEYDRLYTAWQAAERSLAEARANETTAADRLAFLAAESRNVRKKKNPLPTTEGSTPTAQSEADSSASRKSASNASAPSEGGAFTSKPSRVSRDKSQGNISGAAEPDVPQTTVVLDAEPVLQGGEISTGLVAQEPSGKVQSLVLAALTIALAILALAAVRLGRVGAEPFFASADEVAAALAVPVVGLVPAHASSAANAIVNRWQRVGSVMARIALAVAIVTALLFGLQNYAAILQFFTDPLPTLRSLVGA